MIFDHEDVLKPKVSRKTVAFCEAQETIANKNIFLEKTNSDFYPKYSCACYKLNLAIRHALTKHNSV
ncbi:hypothetical protein BpHYR1_007311 [Brachionus plicatilis]|uniref:Uncharacterized protein n=1 Tax=Brachionus plicatilis TaxID=10195 RepID=A0A3M7RBC5_BRAPC|nr:hypothetical protein BpHYR1_007311 [Brachionus plicatilis]